MQRVFLTFRQKKKTEDGDIVYRPFCIDRDDIAGLRYLCDRTTAILRKGTAVSNYVHAPYEEVLRRLIESYGADGSAIPDDFDNGEIRLGRDYDIADDISRAINGV